MASRFELKSFGRTLAFLSGAMRIRRQSLRSPGLLGMSLRAYPLRKEYWTRSAWSGEPALREFMRTDPHRTFMGIARPWCRTATFKFWELPADKLDARELWSSGQQRIADGGQAQ